MPVPRRVLQTISMRDNQHTRAARCRQDRPPYFPPMGGVGESQLRLGGTHGGFGGKRAELLDRVAHMAYITRVTHVTYVT